MMDSASFDRAIGDFSAPLPHPRFSVYRNNVRAAMINALRVRYPVIEQLTGMEFFAAMAGEFSATNRPASAVLIGYGAEFADFIAGYPPASPLPYLADVARLESSWWRAYHAADAAPLAAADFAAVAPEAWADSRFIFHPSLSLLSSEFAAGSIWEAHHGGPPMANIETGVPEFILVARPFADVVLRRITPEAHDFIGRLMAGDTLGEVAEAMQHFDLASHLTALTGLNIITGLAT